MLRRLERAAGIDLSPGTNQVQFGDVGIEATAQGNPRGRSEHVADHAIAGFVAGDVVEQHSRVPGALHEDVHDGADLELAISPFDLAQLTKLANLVEPAP